MKFETTRVKTVLKENKYIDGGWFWSKYSVNPYVGCSHHCTYCFLRAKKYMLDSEKIQVHINTPDILDQELKNKRKDIVIVGGYQAIDQKYELSRNALKVCLKHKFPVMIITKSPLVLRDIDLLKKMPWACVVFSIASCRSKNYLKYFEPDSPSMESRFDALEKLADAGIYTGTALVPALPFITDTEKNIRFIVEETKKRGGKFVMAGGLVLSDIQKKIFLESLKKFNPQLIQKYKQIYKDDYSPNDDSWINLGNLVKKLCLKNKLDYRIKRNTPDSTPNRKISKKIFMNIYEFELQGKDKVMIEELRKLACIIDEYKTPISELLNDSEKKSLLSDDCLNKIDSIAQKLSINLTTFSL